MSEWQNKLYYGDNLVWLRDKDHFPNESVDLIYLDPPFNSKANYNLIFTEPGKEKSPAQIRAFDDTWKWDSAASGQALQELGATKPDVTQLIQWVAGQRSKFSESTAAYLSMMAVRLVELHRVLKPTGSLYLHCDPTASHYLKLLLDTIFRAENLRNEITWKRRHGFTSAVHDSNRFGNCVDIILFYAKSTQAEFMPQYNKDSKEYKEYVERFFTQVDEDGRRYQATSLTNPAYRPNLIYEYKGYKPPKNGWMITKEKMEQWDREGRIHFPKDKSGRLRRKSYADELRGMPIQNLWDDIEQLGAHDTERLRFPTQKPEALLERILAASSNEGDLVLDPFCGCGTTVVVAHKLRRRWIGIDVTWLAIDLIEGRLKDRYGKAVKDSYVVYGKPSDVPSARRLWQDSPKEFEIWVIQSLVKAAPRERDGGVDGLLSIVESKNESTKVIIQVKGGMTVTPSMVRDLIGTVEKERAVIGLLVTLKEPTSGMKALAFHAGSYTSPIWHKSYPRIQIRTVGELLEGRGFDLPYGESPIKRALPFKELEHTKQML